MCLLAAATESAPAAVLHRLTSSQAHCALDLAACVQVGSSGDAVTCCAISPTSQLLGFGTQGGFVHLHGLGPGARVTASGPSSERPVQQPPAVPLQENDSFSLSPFVAGQVGLGLCGPHALGSLVHLHGLGPGARVTEQWTASCTGP